MLSQKDNFRDREKRGWLKVTRWRPSTQIGHFDAHYSPTKQVLTITVNLHFTFLTQREFQEQEGTAGWEGKPATPSWTAGEKDAYKNNFKKIMERVWSRQYRFECTKTGWTEMKATVAVVVKTDASRGASHYVIRAVKVPEGEPFRAMCAHDPIWDGQFCQRDVEYDSAKTRDVAYANFAIAWLEKAIERAGCDYLAFEPGSSKLTAETKQSLLRFGALAGRHITRDFVNAGVKVWVYAKTGQGDRLITARGRSKVLAKQLREVLSPYGVVVEEVGKFSKQPWIKTPMEANLRRRATLSPADLSSRKFSGGMLLMKNWLTNGAAASSEKPSIPRNYIVAAHEFGHMLGLPDEYFGVQCDRLKNEIAKRQDPIVQVKTQKTNERIEGQHEGYAGLISAADVPAPIMGTTGIVTDSIMYAGARVLPAHYVTFFEALINITHPYILASDWKILPDNPNNFIHSWASE